MAVETYIGKLIHLQYQLVKCIFVEFAVEQLPRNIQKHAVMPHHYLPSAFFHNTGVDLKYLAVSLHALISVHSLMNHNTYIGEIQLITMYYYDVFTVRFLTEHQNLQGRNINQHWSSQNSEEMNRNKINPNYM
jgi:hypothetical protein